MAGVQQLVGILLIVMFGIAMAAPRQQPRPAYNFGLSHRVTDLVNLSISFNNQHRGHVVVGLFGKTVPKAVENFKALCTGREGFGYVNSTFHRVLRDFIVQGGDFELGNGKGGYSMFNDNPGRRFTAENFNCPHREGSVAMASESRTRLGSQFYFVAAKEDDVRFLNGKHVVFGHIVSGRSLITKMARVPTSRQDVPKHVLRITACSTSMYVDPQDKLNQPPKKRLLDDDDVIAESVNAAKHSEGPRKPVKPVDAKQKKTDDVKQRKPEAKRVHPAKHNITK
jgi:peptidyl-prolyl cis-trans isomerase B (cyclophilin B)